MLRQRQAKLLNDLYLLISNVKGTKVAEDLLLLLFEEDATTRSSINTYFISFLQDDAYVKTHLIVKTDELWLENLDCFLMKHLIERYDEVETWKLI